VDRAKDEAQWRVIPKDTVDIQRGLIVVDTRHRGVPDWEELQKYQNLNIEAACRSSQPLSSHHQ
jgi:hypothetical protein